MFVPVLPLDFAGSGSSCYFECTYDQLISSCVLICSQNKSSFFCSSPKCPSDIIVLGKCCFLVQPAVCPGLKLGSSSVHSVYCTAQDTCLAYLPSREARISDVCARQTKAGLEPSLHWKLLFCRQLFPALRFRHYLPAKNRLQIKFALSSCIAGQSACINLLAVWRSWCGKSKSHWNRKRRLYPLLRSSCLILTVHLFQRWGLTCTHLSLKSMS